ncbi:MAG: sulfotransferase, partial [Acetobacteraceae bacterium]
EACVRKWPDNALARHDLGAMWLSLRNWPAAIASLRLATLLKPDLVKAHYHLGIAFRQQGRSADAIAALDRAVTLAPRHAEAQATLGDLLEKAGEREAALECFRRARAAAPDTTVGRLARAKALLAEGNFPEAERQLRRTIALDRKGVSGHWILGRMLAALGRFREAIAELELSLTLSPDDIPIYYDLVTAKRVAEADRPLIGKMLATLQKPGLCDHHRSRLEYALGKGFDDLGEYREAIKHFDEANRLNASLVRFDRAALVSSNNRMKARFKPSLRSLPRQAGLDDETPILIVGMPRSGTTLVEQILSLHPEIDAGGEQSFWSRAAKMFTEREAPEVTAADLDRAAGDYLALLHRVAAGKLHVTDKMPGNFRWLGLIHLALPRVRIIHCRRDPIDTCLSNYFADFGLLHAYTCSRAGLVFFYREYLRTMAHWRTFIPPEHLLEIDYETLIAERERVSRQMIAFLGLEWHAPCLNPERNERVVYTASQWQARQPVYRTSVERWRHYEPWLGELRELLQASPAVPRG